MNDPSHAKNNAQVFGMTTPTDPVATRINAAAQELGNNPLVDWASRLLTGEATPGDDGDPDITLLGGMDAVEDYMARVWAAQALVHVWHHQAASAVAEALNDEAWQVRAVALQVIATHEISGLTADVVELTQDVHPQVRSAAVATLGVIARPSDEQAIAALNSAVTSTDSVVADAAETALNRIADAHDRADLRASPRY